MSSSMNGSVLSPLRRDNSSCMSDLKATSKCLRLHLNSLWSIWYGICVATFNGYIVLQSTKRYFDYEDLRLASEDETISTNELNLCIGLTGVSVLFLPFFLMSAIFKVGNLANDGFKLGRNLNACSADPPPGITIVAKNGCQRLWQHCGPTAGLFHLMMAFCVLIPKLIMEARLIQMNVLPKEAVWKTDLDFVIPRHHERSLTSFNFSTSSQNVLTSTTSSFNSSSSTYYQMPTVSSIRPKHSDFIAAASREILTEDTVNFGSASIELLNYALALLIYSVRYPSVFWGTNKCFGLLFSIQLLINSAQCLLLHCGICILYKIHVIGSKEQLPYLNMPMINLFLRFGKPFILNKDVTLTLYVMSVVLILISSLVLYLYGYSRLSSFLHREQARRIISIHDLQSGRSWGYFTHCVALCVLVAIAVCEAPLLYDLSVVYRGSLDSLVLIIISASILHLFVWVLLWLILTLKQHWEFKLRVTVGQAAVRSAKSIKLVTDLHLVSSMSDHANAPLLVVGHGKTYTISDSQAKRSIMAVIQKANLDKKIKIGNVTNAKNVLSDDIDDQIYWLRPKSRTPRTSPDSSSSENRFGWFTKKRKPNRNGLEEMTALNGKYTSNKRNSATAANDVDDDDGDYVRLREIPINSTNIATPRGEHSDDTTSEDNKLLESVRNDTVTYASVNKELLNPSVDEFDDPSPLLTPEPEDHDDLPPPPPELSIGYMSPIHNDRQDVGKCLQRSDSGMPTEEIPSRSDSEVSAGGSPPDKTCCSNSETSSGVHSNSSRESGTNNKNSSSDYQRSSFNNNNNNSSIVGLFNESMQKIQPQQWMQRNVQQSTTAAIASYGMIGSTSAVNRVYKPQQHYAIANKTPSISEVGEDNNNAINNNTTVVIMRKHNNNHNHNINNNNSNYHQQQLQQHHSGDIDSTISSRFGRSTNMRLTSFTAADHCQSSASTLPHYPTQPAIGQIASYAHCSTMPPVLTASSSSSSSGNNNDRGLFGNISSAANTSGYGSFPRPHTTIPAHHNGIRFGNPSQQQSNLINPYCKRILPLTHSSNYMKPIASINSSSNNNNNNNMNNNNSNNNTTAVANNQSVTFRTSHHTFPQPPHPISSVNKYYLQQNSERDSANFSATSSSNSESDVYNNHRNNNNNNNNGGTIIVPSFASATLN